MNLIYPTVTGEKPTLRGSQLSDVTMNGSHGVLRPLHYQSLGERLEVRRNILSLPPIYTRVPN